MASISYSEDYNIIFSRVEGLKIYDDYYRMIEIHDTLNDITEGLDKPWNLNWEAEPLLKSKFSLSENGKFQLCQTRVELKDGTCEYGEAYIPFRNQKIIMPLEIIL